MKSVAILRCISSGIGSLKSLFVLYCCFFCLPFSIWSQEPDSVSQSDVLDSVNMETNAYYFDLLGSGILWSINYERKLLAISSSSVSVYGRIGFTAFPITFWNTTEMVSAIPLELGIYGNKKTSLEIGYGSVMFLNDADRLNYVKVGVRLNKSANKILKITPMIFFARDKDADYADDSISQPWIGLSFGKYF